MTARKANPNYRWVIMIINVLICALAYAGLTTWSMASPKLAETFKISATVASLGSSLFMLGYAVGSLVENAIAIRKGFRAAGIVGLLMMVIGCFGIPIAPNYAVVLLFRFMQGWGILWLVGVNSTVAWFPARQRGLASGIAGSGNALGMGCGGLLATALLNISGSWQGAFRAFGIVLLVGAVIWAVLMRNPPKDLYPEDAIVETGVTNEKEINPYKTVAAWLCGLCLFALAWHLIGFNTVVGSYVTKLGYSDVQAGTVILFCGLVGIPAPVLAGFASDALAKRMSPLRARSITQAICFAVAAVTVCLYPIMASSSIGMAVFGAVLVGAGTPAVNATLGALPMDLLGNQKAANKMFALTCLVGLGAGGFAAPFIANYSAENFGFNTSMIVLGLGAVFGIIISLVLPKFKLKH
ncbi:MAG TPA: hypothetical protein DEQ02_02530 [Ruminococcaceae bacterium]|nr:hypothetical protein [Oscillospiraceae bacterium]